MSNICKFIDADGSLRQILIYRNVCYSNPLTRKLVNVLFLKLFLQILRKQHWTSCIKLIVCLENLLKYWQTHAICSLYISEKFSFPQTLFNPYSFFGFSTTFMNKINTKRILWSFFMRCTAQWMGWIPIQGMSFSSPHTFFKRNPSKRLVVVQQVRWAFLNILTGKISYVFFLFETLTFYFSMTYW